MRPPRVGSVMTQRLPEQRNSLGLGHQTPVLQMGKLRVGEGSQDPPGPSEGPIASLWRMPASPVCSREVRVCSGGHPVSCGLAFLAAGPSGLDSESRQ